MGYMMHVISHTHWDREWYLSFQEHRMRLVDLLDRLLETLDTDSEYRSFNLDGQTIIIEDYLAIRPEMREKISEYIKEGRLQFGPWYVLQDEFLPSGEAQIRNMIIGHKMCKEFGGLMKVGYLPDAFGHISQMPQLLQGFGIDNAVFGRGINPLSSDSKAESKGERGYHSEVTWMSPDGSRILGIFMANWYGNAVDIPADPEEAVKYIRNSRDSAARFATTPHLLLMNGSDHTPSQSNLSEVLRAVRERLEDDEIIHSTLPQYIEAVKACEPKLDEVYGELRSEYTDGWGTLTNVLSSRLYLKKLNFEAERLLERWAEPLAVASMLCGKGYPASFFEKSWKFLIENHPHDSICGCSVDEVHEEMVVRFKNSMQISAGLQDRALKVVCDKIDTTFLGDAEKGLVVMNSLSWRNSGVVEAVVDYPEDFQAFDFLVLDENGKMLPCSVRDLGVVWTYELPDDRFRIPKNVRRFIVSFFADNVPGCGYKVYTLRPVISDSEYTSDVDELVCVDIAEYSMENEFLRVVLNEDGSIDITDKQSGAKFLGLNIYEDMGDAGNEYNFRSPENDKRILSSDCTAKREVESIACTHGAFKVIHAMEVPASLSSDKRSRTEETVELEIVTYITLATCSKRVDIRTEIHNNAKWHRLRALFPTGIETDSCYADSQFDVVKRNIQPWAGWKNPSNCQSQQAFVDVTDGNAGLMIANRGLPEYEVLRDGSNTVALTILRGVGELGDWGVFPTPGAQCEGLQVAEYSIILHVGTYLTDGAYREGYGFSYPMLASTLERHSGVLPAEKSLVEIQGDGLVIAAIKKAENRDSVIVRFYSIFDESQVATIGFGFEVSEAYLVTLNEERQEKLKFDGNSISIDVPVKKIITLEVIPK